MCVFSSVSNLFSVYIKEMGIEFLISSSKGCYYFVSQTGQYRGEDNFGTVSPDYFTDASLFLVQRFAF